MIAKPESAGEELEGYRPAMLPARDLIIIAATSGLASWLSVAAAAERGTIATLWLTNGLVLGILLTYPSRHWPVIFLAALAGNLSGVMATGLPLTLALCFALCNLIEIGTGLAILYKPGDPVQHFTERKSALRVCSGVLVPPLASCAFAGVVNYSFRHTDFLQSCRLWFVAHALGLEIMTPLALAVRHDELHAVFARGRPRIVSSAAVLLLVGVSIAVFAQTTYPFLFMIFPPLVLAVFLMGFVGMSIGLVVVATATMGFTLAGRGPLMLAHSGDMSEHILIAQAFLLTAIIMTLPVAVALAERRRMEQKLLVAQDQLRSLALTDQLTGLSNRRLFDEFSVREWKRAVRERSALSAIMIDVDLFKLYNDRYGHPAGDKCLAAVASAVGAVANRPGDLAARYGGEEFVVMLAGTTSEGCEFVAERVRKSVEMLQLPHGGSPFGKVTVSVGFATASPDAQSELAGLIEMADKALYAAKTTGRNTACGIDEALRQAS